jgi:hypothetical protein
MIYAIKLGPIETGEGPVNAYVGIRDDGYLVRPVMGRRDNDALRQLAAESDPGEKLLCEGKLARAGSTLGFESAPMPAWVPLPRASLAIALALGPLMVPGDPSALHMLCHGATEFLRAKPWRYWTDNEPVEVVLDGAVQARYEGALMGAGGMEFGVALYKRAGALERIARAVDAGRMKGAAREDAIAVTLDDKPRFAIDALHDAYGLDRLPVPIKLVGGGAAAISGEDVAILGGTLRLLAMLTPEHRTGAMAVGNEDHEIRIAITMPPVAS